MAGKDPFEAYGGHSLTVDSQKTSDPFSKYGGFSVTADSPQTPATPLPPKEETREQMASRLMAKNVATGDSLVTHAGDYTPVETKAPTVRWVRDNTLGLDIPIPEGEDDNTKAQDMQVRSNKIGDLIDQKVMTQYQNGEVTGNPSQLVKDEARRLGYEMQAVTLPNGIPSHIYMPIKGYKPDAKWLEEQRNIIFNQKVSKTKAQQEANDLYLSAEYNPNSYLLDPDIAPKGLGEAFLGAFPFGFFNPALKRAQTKADQRMSAVQDHYKEIADLYAAPLVRQTTIATKSDGQGTISDPLQKLDYKNPETYTAIDESTAALREMFPKTADDSAQFRFGAIDASIDANYSANPTQAQVKRSNYSRVGANWERTESQALYAQQLANEKYAMLQNINRYQGALDVVKNNIKTIQDDANDGGITPERQASLTNNLALQTKLEDNIAAKREWANFFQGELGNLKGLKDYLTYKDMTETVAELYPMSTALKEMERSIISIPGKITGFAYDVGGRFLGGEDIANQIMEESGMITTDYTAGDYFSGKMPPLGDKYTGLEATSITNATAAQIFDEQGNLDVNVNWPSLIYHTGKVAVESFLLGGAMSGARATLGGISEGAVGDLALKTTLTEVGIGSRGLTSGLEYASIYGRVGGGFAAESMVGSVAPSIMMFGHDMLKQEMELGLSFDQALGIATMRASIEGLTERIFPNEMMFYKTLMGRGVIRTFDDLTTQQGYRLAIERAFAKVTGKTMSDKTYRLLFRPAIATKAAFATFGEEAAEEIVGDLANLLPNHIAKDYNPAYDDSAHQFNLENEINTAVMTAATMLPMGGVSGAHSLRQYTEMQKAAQLLVGLAPSPYIEATTRLETEGKISKEESQRRLTLIGQLTAAAQTAKLAAVASPAYQTYTKDQQKLFEQALFNKQVDINRITNEIGKVPAEAMKGPLLEQLQTSNEAFQNLISTGLYSSQAERVKNASVNLNFYVNQGSVKTLGLESLVSLRDKLVAYGTGETDPVLKELYAKKVEILKDRIDFLVKAKEQASPEAAVKNNEQGSIPILHEDGRETKLTIGATYVASAFEYRSVEGSLMKYTPIVKVLADNGDGSVTVSIGGETSSIAKEDLAKFNFLPKETLDQWRKEDDIRALILDNYNKVFTFSFKNENNKRIKTPEGRIFWDPKAGKAFFIYKDKSGTVRQQELRSEDFKKNLKLVRSLQAKETEADFNRRQTEYQERLNKAKMAKLDAQQAHRTKVFQAFMEQESKKVTKMYDKAIKQLQTGIKGTKMVIASVKELRKHPLQLSAKLLQEHLPREVWGQLVSDRGYAVTKEGTVIKPPVGEALTEAETARLFGKFSPYEVLTALNAHIAKLQKENVDPVESQIQDLIAQRDRALDALALDYDQYINGDYESDRTLTEQVREYRDSMKEQLKETTNLINKLKDFVTQAKEMMSNIRNRIIEIIPKLAAVTFDPTETDPQTPQNMKETLEELDVEVAAAETKLAELEPQLEALPRELEKLEKLLRFLKRKEKEFSEEKAKVNIQKAAEEIFKSQHSSQTASETNPPAQDEAAAKAALIESAKIELSKLFNSTTSSSPRAEDGTLTDEPVSRLQEFLNTIDNPEDYSVLLVTKDNAEKLGLKDIIFTGGDIKNVDDNEAHNDIRLVIVKNKGEGGYDFVDKTGTIVATPAADNVVYTAMRLAKLNWSDGDVNYAIKGVGLIEIEAFAEQLRKNHADFRQQIINLTKEGQTLMLPVTGVSRGHANLEGGLTSVVDNLIPANTDLVKTQVIEIAKRTAEGVKTGQVIFQGTHSLIPMPAGRPVLTFGQNLAFLHNKAFTKQDIDKLTKVFVELYNRAKKNNGELDKDIVKYLSKVLYWRDPKKVSRKTDKGQVGETIGRGQIWYDRETKTLNLGNQNVSIPFTFEGNDQANFNKLTAFLSGVFHNVDSQDLIGVPFTEIVEVTKKGKLMAIEWPSYQTYLLSPTYPDGTPRAVEDIPLTTTTQPSKPGIPNIRGRYLTYNNESNDEVVSTAGYTITTVPGEPETVKIEQKLTGTTPVQNNADWTLVPGTDFSKLDKDENKEYEIRTTQDNGETQIVTFTFGKNGNSFVVGHNVMDQFNTPITNQEIKKSLDQLISGERKTSRPKIYVRPRAAKATGAFVAKGDVQAMDSHAKSLPFTPLVKNIAEDKGFKKAEAAPQGEFKPKVEGTKDTGKAKDLIAALKKRAGTTPQDDTNYRLATKRSYELENMKEAKRWWEDRFPQIAFHSIVGLVDGKAWGVVRNAAVTLSHLAEVGTVLHEAFEAVHKYFLSPAQLRAIRNEFRRRKGSFIEYGTGNIVEYSKASDFQIKEQLAEEYREYGLSNGKVFFQGDMETKSLLQRVLDFVNWVTRTPIHTIQEVFDKIQDAKYRDAVPNLDMNNIQSDYRIDQIKQEHVTFFHDAMRSITNLVFEHLRKQDVPIPEFLVSGYDPSAAYSDAKVKIDGFYGGEGVAEMIKTYTQEGFVKDFSNPDEYNQLIDNLSPALTKGLTQFALSRNLTGEETLAKLYDVLKSYAFMHDNWAGFVSEHKLYLGKYGIEFTEDESVLEIDENDAEGAAEYGPNHLKLSRKLNASTEVKLLIATLREMEIPPAQRDRFGLVVGKKDPQPKLNSLLMSQLVDYNKTIINLLYKMVNTTNFDEMAAKLKEMTVVEPSLSPLLDKLKLAGKTYQQDFTGEQLSPYDTDLRNKFYTSLSNMLAEYHKLLLNSEDFTGGIVNLNEQKAIGLVKDRWLSNLKLNTKLVRLEQGLYKIKTSDLPVKSITDERTALRFLHSIGIDFPENLARLTKEDRAQFLNSAKDLLKILYSTDPDALLSENATTREPLTALATMYVSQTGSYAEPTHMNVEGEMVQNILLHNSIGIIIKNFNASKTLDEVYKRMPFLNPDTPGNSFLKFSQILKRGGAYFDANGTRRKSITIDLLDGSQVRDSESGTPTSNLNFVDRVGQEFANNVSGLFHTLIPGDTKSEWGFGFGQFVTPDQIQNDAYILGIFKDYLRAEIMAVQDFLNEETSDDVHLNNHAEKGKIGAQLRFFKGILRSVDPDFTLNITKERTPDDIIKANEDYIDKAILAYLEEDTEKTFQFFQREGIIRPYKAAAESASGTGFVAGKGATGTFVPGTSTGAGFVPKGATQEEAAEEEYTGKYSVVFVPREFIKTGLTSDEVFDLVKYGNLNYVINMIEQHKLIWGDPGMWKDMAKRTKSFTSGRMLSIANAPYFNEFHNRHSNQLTFTDSEGTVVPLSLDETDFGHWTYNDLIRTQVMRDVTVVSKQFETIKAGLEDQTADDIFPGKTYATLTDEERKEVDKHLDVKEVKAYEEVNEADAQSWATMMGYREIRQRANSWTEAEEEVYQWDTALARWEITNGIDYRTKKSIPNLTAQNLYPVGTKGELLKQHDEALLAKGNPYLNRAKANKTLPVFNILKPIQAGPKADDRLINNLIKTSTAPISWRLSKGTGLTDWYITHAKAGTTFVAMTSANKVGGTTNMPEMYDRETGRPNLVVAHEYVNFQTYGIQVETITQKDKSTLGTQMTKQATLNLMSGGVPVDFIKANPDKSRGEIVSAWDSLSLEEQLKHENFRLSHRNNELLAALKEIAKREVFDEFGITESEDEDGRKTFEFTNLDRFEELIQRELNLRNAPENVKEFAKTHWVTDSRTGALVKSFAMPFDLIIGSDKLESLLTSVIDKHILRPKMYGGQFPQVSSTMFERHKRNLVKKNAEGKWEAVDDYSKLTTEEKNKTYITSNELKFYTKKDGKTQACEIMVPFYFKELIKAGKELSVDDIPAELLEGVGFRIPTQGVNAMEFFVIKGFLPVEYGNAVIVPSEITAKSGSDFDIDKLNIYLHNYRMRRGKPYKIPFLTNENSTVQERFDQMFRKYNKMLQRLEDIIQKDFDKNVLQGADEATNKLWASIYSQLVQDTSAYTDEEINDLLAEGKFTDKLLGAAGRNLTPFERYEKVKELAAAEKESHPDEEVTEFARLPIEMQNIKQAVENEYIDNVREILALPQNYAQLVEPNSARVLKKEAEKINRMYQKESTAKSFTNFLSRLKNAESRHSFLVGKGGVGIGAASQSQHAVAQIVGLPLTESFDTEGERTFNFPTNSEASEDGKTITYHLADVFARDGRSISSVLSAFISALVDVNKDPFIIDINGNKETLGAYMTAARMGIPVGLMVRWFNQPIIREYVKAKERDKSILAQAISGGKRLKQREIIAMVLRKFQASPAQSYMNQKGEIAIPTRSGDYTEHELDEHIKHFVAQQASGKPQYTQEFADAQAQLLKEFVALEALQWQLFDWGQALVDTTRNINLDGIRLKDAKVIKALNGPFRDSVVKVLRTTFQGNILRIKLQFLESLRPLYLTESPTARLVLNPILNSLFNSRLRNDVKEKEAKNMRRAFITYLIHTIPISISGQPSALLTDVIKDLFLGKDNIARQVRRAQEEQQESGEENFFLKNLLATAPGKAHIRLLRKSSDKIDQDLLTSDFLNLRNNPNGLAENLIKMAMLQSGVSVTPTSFQELIPNEMFAQISNQVRSFMEDPSNDLDRLVANFHNSYYENNWKNPNIVPKADVKTSTGGTRLESEKQRTLDRRREMEGRPPVDYIPWLPGTGLNFLEFYVDSTGAGGPGYRPSWGAFSKYLMVQRIAKDEEGDFLYTRREMEEMKNRGDWSFLEQTLYKRLEVLNEDGQLDAPVVRRNYTQYKGGKEETTETRYVLFYPVNKKGDGMNAVEHYSKKHASAFYPEIPLYEDQLIYNALQAQPNGSSGLNSVTNLFLGQHFAPHSGGSVMNLAKDLLVDSEDLSNLDLTNEDLLKAALTNLLMDPKAETEESTEKPIDTGETESDPFKCKV